MKAFSQISLLIIAFFCIITATGCTDAKAVIDENTVIANRTWSYANKISYDVKIDDETVPYNLYLNLRVTADYKYSNIFVLVKQSAANQKSTPVRYEFKLANPDGEWLGKGSGNLFSYQTLFKSNYKFAAKGVYHFEIEQNMRDNPLREVSDVGLRVEKAE